MRMAMEYAVYGLLALMLLAAATVVASKVDEILVNAAGALRTALGAR